MKTHRLITFVLLVVALITCSCRFKSATTCNSFFDDACKNKRMKISIRYFIELNQKYESVLIYKDKKGHFCAELESSNIKNKKIELSQSQLKTLTIFETHIRNQSLKTNTTNVYSDLGVFTAKYQIRIGRSQIDFSSKDVYYSLIKDILN